MKILQAGTKSLEPSSFNGQAKNFEWVIYTHGDHVLQTVSFCRTENLVYIQSVDKKDFGKTIDLSVGIAKKISEIGFPGFGRGVWIHDEICPLLFSCLNRTPIYQTSPEKLEGRQFLSLINNNEFEWIVYWYKEDYCHGGGQVVALRKKDSLIYADYNVLHRSCCGSISGLLLNSQGVTAQEFFKDKEGIFDVDVRPEIKDKVRELLK